MKVGRESRIAGAAPKPAPDVAPRTSGDTMGFLNRVWYRCRNREARADDERRRMRGRHFPNDGHQAMLLWLHSYPKIFRPMMSTTPAGLMGYWPSMNEKKNKMTTNNAADQR